MSKILVLGATGSLGRHIVQRAISADHEVSIMVRRLSSVPAEVQRKVVVHEADIAEMSTFALATIFRNPDAVINTAGYVSNGQSFVDLTAHIVTSLESIPEKEQPVCWFMAGAALLDINEHGPRGVDLPLIRSTYWPHRVNFDSIHQTTLDWRILCPGPMVDQAALGLSRMRISLEGLPVQVPAFSKFLPKALALPFFTYRIPEMIVSYADAAALILANITPNDEMSHHRVGLALPVGMRGKKKE